MHKAFHFRDDVTDYMCQENGEQENLPTSKTALTHRFNDYVEKRGERQIKANKNNNDNTGINWTESTRKQNG